MKKTVFLTSLLLMLSVGYAFAASTITGTYSDGALSFAVSNGVALNVNSTASAYVAMSMHKSGSRCFLTDQTESKVYWQDATPTVVGGVITAGWPATPAAGATNQDHGTPDPTDGTWAAL